MTGSSFATAVGAWPKRDEEAFQRGKKVLSLSLSFLSLSLSLSVCSGPQPRVLSLCSNALRQGNIVGLHWVSLRLGCVVSGLE
jgi:hypothetical protein